MVAVNARVLLTEVFTFTAVHQTYLRSMCVAFISLVALASLGTAMLDRPHATASASSRSPRMALLRLAGGEGDGVADDVAPGSPVTVRVRTSAGLKRTTMPSAESTLADLERELRREHRLAVKPGQLSRAAGGVDPLGEADAATSLRELGIAHGTMLHLAASVSAPSPPASTSSASASRARRKRHTSMADFEAERAKFEIILETPKPSSCAFVAVERQAAKRFSDYLLDMEFETRRVALLFGRWEHAPSAGGKSGVHVDVVYEPPQTCDEASMAIDADAESAAEVARAHAIAKALGLAWVGFAYAHPPRHHTMETLELMHMALQRAAAVAQDAHAARLFVCMRFRPVYEDEPLDADVTAEVYQPTEQLGELVAGRDVVRDGGVVDGSALVQLAPESGLSFKLAAEAQPSADATYFFTRVHDLAKPYTPPAHGALRTSFPPANRGAPLRKFHLRTYLAKQREAGVAFSQTARDFQLLLHASGLLPPALIERLCAAVASTAGTQTAKDKREAALAEAEARLSDLAGLEPPSAAKGGVAKKKKKTK